MMSKIKAIFLSYAGVTAFAAVIFIAGGKIFYWQAWLYLFLAILGTTMTHIMTPANSNLSAERATRAKEGEGWDRKLLGLIFLVNFLGFIVAGLDSGRFGWSGEMPLLLVIIGAILMLAGQYIFALARRENSFFSSTVRIEKNRIHSVCETGPYHFIRHPGYLGMILSNSGFSFVIGSYWTLIPMLICLILLVIRTNREDQFLMSSLNKYKEYSVRVKYKLFPGVL